ncbi:MULTISPECIES: UDP-N-acetylmuramate dehydrogenase [Cryobacterium]|uniref:UDP-N-acetylenolpyruvoylglucosamine reductase n=1 Tax=Cryobacterium glucosi TaxID=1259175 RepID=A0ABY2ISH4_9MICO|nr:MULTISPECIES: UDP-N-acetylmuramate dehydrogenase [Cryobacterium]MEB0002919.1 UDP-N-acetylmuramate dehydrogenase [Cryobacterium sp. RTC2.1]TFB98598.1 UDP-N-acetylmuramate dehydrogenase [Cryobacterium sp. MDB2-A-1]TFC06232.1 UDP-N-acetylmuramate dehydrogenase [Cryobacterium sp. MDB2-33-2]TFC13787.1 UDP-N-acetylmuramate dehydrogenase [Cryobacterium sp. MDB2-A-2]TFC18074.1 UDP-N-acetylmuramate dehydrogenase [Cryobacterium sp. MDB2-10]
MVPADAAPTTFADLTTIRTGGRPLFLLAPETEDELIETVQDAWASGEDWLLLGGGSNTVAADTEFDGTVVRVLTRGITVERSADRVILRVQAGEPWDDLVAHTVAQGWSGIEALSGIPGSTGAAPVQNIGAYGQELANSLVAIDFLDYESGERRRIPAAELELGYRTSLLKHGLRGLVVAVELELWDTAAEASVLGAALSRPLAFPQLADALGVHVGDRVPLADVRATVLRLRAAKGMLLNPGDPDAASAGSFFTNPIVSLSFSRTLPESAPRWPLDDPELPDRVIPLEDYYGIGPVPGAVEVVPLVKLSAAWLIEHAGISRGFRLPGSRAAVSSKHTLALTNTGGASGEEIAQLARFVQQRVQAEFGVILQPEPVLVGLGL